MMDTRNHLIWVRKDFSDLAPLLGLTKVMRVSFMSQMSREKVVVHAFTGNKDLLITEETFWSQVSERLSSIILLW
jgi:hypothetical protein